MQSGYRGCEGEIMARDDYYYVLGLNHDADIEKIKKAYHADATPSQKNAKRFREIKEAYETLRDPRKRDFYDRELARKGSSFRLSGVPERVRERKSFFRGIDEHRSWTDDYLGGFLPGFYDQERPYRKDLCLELILSPDEAIRGGLLPIEIPVYEECPRCHTSGLWEGFYCSLCMGYGRIAAERKFSLYVPPGIGHGTEEVVPLDDIGLSGSRLHLTVLIQPEAL
jgi:molecular chaperone DnaJ